MPSASLKPGMLVLHPWHPRWGPGKIVAITDPTAHVFFRDHLQQKAMVVNILRTRLRIPEQQSDALLDRLPQATQVGTNWLLPSNFRDLMARAQVAELENSLRRAMQQNRLGRISFCEVGSALAQLKLIWTNAPTESDTYDLAPAAERTATTASYDDEQDTDGWTIVEVRPKRLATAKPSRAWWLGMTTEFTDSISKLHRALRKELFAAIRDIARDPEPLDTTRTRPLAVEIDDLWCYRLGEYRLLYRPDHDQHVIVLLAFGQKTSRYD